MRLFHEHRSRGYTVVEVLLSLTVLAIGASAVMSMQKSAVVGNLDARKTDMANAIGRLWIERLRKDALQWTLPTASNPASNFSNARLLSHVPAVGNPPTWQLLTDYIGNTPSISPAFNILGQDVPTGSSPVFCVHVALTYLYFDVTNAENNLIRADVRVVWPRSVNLVTAAASPCDSSLLVAESAAGPSPQLYNTLYMTTAIRENAVP